MNKYLAKLAQWLQDNDKTVPRWLDLHLRKDKWICSCYRVMKARGGMYTDNGPYCGYCNGN